MCSFAFFAQQHKVLFYHIFSGSFCCYNFPFCLPTVQSDSNDSDLHSILAYQSSHKFGSHSSIVGLLWIIQKYQFMSFSSWLQFNVSKIVVIPCGCSKILHSCRIFCSLYICKFGREETNFLCLSTKTISA